MMTNLLIYTYEIREYIEYQPDLNIDNIPDINTQKGLVESMTKEGLEYLSSYTQNMLNDDCIVRIVKQNYAIKTTKEDFDKLSFNTGNIKTFYCDYLSGKMMKAYEPFMDVIRECIFENNIDLGKFFTDAGIYSLNRSVFMSYITTGKARSRENLILAEKDYDRKKFVEGIVNMLLLLSKKKPIFIMLNEANQMSESVLFVLEELVKRTSNTLHILVVINEMGNIKGYINEAYTEFIKKSDLKGIVSDWPFQDYYETEETEETENGYVFTDSYEEIENICTMFYTYAFEQADYYLGMIYQKVELDKADVTIRYRINMLTLYIMVSIYREDYSYALILCEKLCRIDAMELEDEKNYLYYYFQTMANMYIGNEEDARKNAVKCREAAARLDREYEYFQSMLIQNMAELAGWKDIWICDKEIEVPDELISMCYRYDYLNHLAHIYVYCFDNDYRLYTVVEGIEERTPNVTKGILLAKKLNNEKFLVEAYRKNIMLASYKGLFQTAGYFYNKSIEIVKKDNNKFEEANIYNGLGYICCTTDKYSEANRYYNRALKIFYDEKNSDYIMETLYNMGTNAILAGDYIHATEYLMTVNNILKKLKKNSLRVCNISKMFGLLALSLFKQGNYYAAQIYTNKSENFLKCILDYGEEEFYNYLWDDDMFLYFYVSALIDTKSGKYEEALKNYDKAEIYMTRGVGNRFFSYIHFAVDKSMLLNTLGRNEESRQLLTEARTYFNSTGNFVRVKMLDDLICTGKIEYPAINMPVTEVNLDDIMTFVRMESIEHEAESRSRQIKFFGTFQELLNHSYTSVDNEINTLITNFKNNFNLDNLMFISYENEYPEIKYSDLEYELTEHEMDILVDYFKHNTVGFAISKYSNNYHSFERIMKIFDRSKVFSIIGAPIYKYDKLYSFFITFVKIPESWNAVINREVLDEDELEVYMLVFRQILDAIEKYRLNEQLKKQAVTDELTGLLNRKGYYEVIEKMFRNYFDRNEKLSCTFMYIDLDHFKYYNDTFGHHVGDAILKRFADIFTEACGDDGYVIRFGGDEFVILINTTDMNIINKISEKIYELIDREEGFTNLVKKYVKYDVVIPEKFRTTCSIGVEMGINMTTLDDIAKIQKHADSALYYVKKNGRGKLAVYDSNM